MPWARKRTPSSFFASSLNTSMKTRPIVFRFCSGSSMPASSPRKRSRASTASTGMPSPSREAVDHLRRLVLSQHAVVHEDCRRTLPHGPQQQGRHHRGVDAAGESADHLSLPHPLAHGRRRLFEVGGHPPVAAGAAGAEEEVAQHLAAGHGVRHLGVELDAVEPALRILERHHGRVAGAGRSAEARRQVAARGRRGSSRRSRASRALRRAGRARRSRPRRGRTRGGSTPRRRRPARAPSPACRSRSPAPVCRARTVAASALGASAS